jgi:type IV pilus assembly protein PilQ
MNQSICRRAIPILALALLAGGAPAALAQAVDGPGPVTINAVATPASQILEILAERSGLNIVATPEAAERLISIKLRETPFSEALNVVVRAAGLAYERLGDTIVVADPQRLSAPIVPLARVFKLEYANPVEVASILQVISADVVPDLHGNQVIFRGGWSQIEEAARIVAEVDRKPAQILLEARLIEINRTKLQRLGIDWEKITSYTTVFTEGPSEPSGLGVIPDEVPYARTDQTAHWYRQRAAFEMTLEAMIRDGNARMLANSKVVTLDGEPATIFAGETVPVVITSLQSGAAGGTFQTVQLERIDVGVQLDITPRISAGGLITALVEPQVSRIIGFVGPDNDLPQTTTRRARTLVRVQDSETIFIGGLLSEESRTVVKRVPLLGHIPLLGLLFQHRAQDEVRYDLVIQITPRIVGDAGAGLPAVLEEVPANLRDEVRWSDDLLRPAAPAGTESAR